MAFTVVVYLVICAAFYLPGYVLAGIGLYTIAKRRGIERPWIAWVPMMNVYLMGCISDQYQAIVRGKQKNKRTVLLMLALGILALCGVMMSQLFTASDNTLLFLLTFLPAWCMMAALLVISFMALYDLYVSCDPKNAVLFLVLSILFSVTQPVFLFVCRNKDLGFPL